MSDSVLMTTDDAILTIKLNRPDVFNAFNDEMGSRFFESLQVAADPAIRCVIVTGEGKAFCSGEDLRALDSSYSSGVAPDVGEILRRRYNPSIVAIRALEKPVIASINGVAAGAGVSLALACDYRVMADDSSLRLAFSKVGLVPDAGGTWLLPRYLGVGKALELAITSEPVSAQAALELGLVNRLSGRAELEEATLSIAREWADGPTMAYSLMKRLIWESFDSLLDQHLEAEAVAQTKAAGSADHLEGVRAFAEKRPPRFEGR